MPGWIKIHRQIQNCLIWDDKPFNMASAWIDLLLLANHEDKETIFDKKPILVKRGQRITSVRELSARWGWGKDKTLRFLRLLESEKMIVKDSDSRRTLLTIVNYGVYQDCETENETVIRTLTGQSQATNKNDKNDKNNNICSNSDDLNETGKPKKKKQKLTEEESEELLKNFEIIYNSYPRKVGRTAGFELYKQWLKGKDIGGTKIKLTNKQIWLAIARYKKYLEDNETEKQYIKQFDTFMRKPILDYVGEDEQ